MRFTRRRSERHESSLGRAGSSLDALERRELLAGPSGIPFYQPTDLPPRTVQHQTAPITIFHPLSSSQRQLSLLDNDGKVLTGKDRQGDEWVITVHGPGAAIVTDATPNDGVLDDDLDTIQLIGTSIDKTYVTGQVISSARLLTDGVVTFNHLYDLDGVASVILNGFTLTQNVPVPATSPVFSNAAIFLPGGARFLQFHDIEGSTDLSITIHPIDIVIGNPTTPLAVQPTIRLESIFNTVFESTATAPPTGPQTLPTVRFLVNGELHGMEIVSSTAAPVPAAFQFQFPLVGTTGRTAIRASSINHLKVVGSAHNLTVARRATPFQNGISGIDHLGSASFGGNADAVGLDVTGPIGKLEFLRGLGNPTGLSTAATAFGTPVAELGYPAFGLLGGLVTARSIGSLNVGPANTMLQTAQDPDFIQLRRQGSTNFFPRAVNALSNAAIVSSDSIGHTTIVGNAQQSEIKGGFHYPSFVAGLEPTRSGSHIRPLRQRGDLVDAVVSATYRPVDNTYGNEGDIAGPGLIQGHFNGGLVKTGAATALNNIGAGFYARHKIGYLPPPERPKRVQSVLVRT